MNYRDHIKRLFASTGESLSWTEIVNKTQGVKAKGIKDLRKELLALVLEGYVERKSFDEFEYVADSQRLGSGAVTPLNILGSKNYKQLVDLEG